MQRFYFHIKNGVDARDEEGKELRDLEAAREHARRSAIFSAAGAIKDRRNLVRSHCIQIADLNGKLLDTVYFGDVASVKD